MNIAIDANEANEENRVGVHQYAFEIIKNIYRISNTTKKENRFTLYLKRPPKSDLPKESDWWKYKVLTGDRLWVLSKLMPHLLVRNGYDVLFVPSHYAPIVSRIPVVSTIHDLGYLEFSGQFKKYDFWQLKVWTAISLYISKYIIAVSNATKQDVLSNYRFIGDSKVQTIYHGYDKLRFKQNISNESIQKVRVKYGIPKNYILYLGTLKPSKNIDAIVRSFSKLKIRDGWYLVIAGKKGWMYESIYDLVKKLNLTDSVIFTGYVDEIDKPPLYAGARVLMSPSFWEGFGMQILEAYACGTPAIVSREGSIPEVAGEAGLYVNPKNLGQITKMTEYMLHMDDKEYNILVQKCIQISSYFSWEKAAEETLEVLQKAASST